MIGKAKILMWIVIAFLAYNISNAQQDIKPNSFRNDLEDKSNGFYFDAVVFKGETSDSARVDAFFIIPYKAMEFKKTKSSYVSSYSLNLMIVDTLKNEIIKQSYERSIAEPDYSITRGSTGAFDAVTYSIKIPRGPFKIVAELEDKFSKKVLTKTRNITVINFDEFSCSLSGLMLVSSIEENGGKFSITPHVSDNVGSLKDGFFTFFEVYNKTENDSMDFSYVITDNQGKSLVESDGIRKYVGKGRKQVFLKIPRIKSFSSGVYILQIEAYKVTTDSVFKPENLLAVAKRSLKSAPSVSGLVLADIDKAIKQLRYVATTSEIDWITEGKTTSEREARFEMFWKKLDPSPNTEKNEAFDAYYQRIEYANTNFKSYKEGWLNDRGIVYIVYGPPLNVERSGSVGLSDPNSDGYETWYYSSGMQFVFRKINIDEYVLYKPNYVHEKFKYGAKY